MSDNRTIGERLCAAQLKMQNPLKVAMNGHFKSKYVTLDVLRDAVVPHLAAEGLALIQEPGFADGMVTLRTVLLCDGDERDCGTLAVPLGNKGNPSHAVGSALTYMRRYSLEAVAGVCGTADDDGNGNHRQGQQAPQQRRPDPYGAMVKQAGITAANAGDVMAYLQANFKLPAKPQQADKSAALMAFDARHGLQNLVDAAAEWKARQEGGE
jgi:hypothetical protein